MPIRIDDKRVRVSAFRWLDEQVQRHGDVLPRALLTYGFEIDGHRVPLMSRQGIFKPRVLPEIPISITTTAQSPYDDRAGSEGLLLYSYRGTNPGHPENKGLRKAMRERVPLIYFHVVVPGKYLAMWPVFIVGDSPETLTFSVAVDDRAVARSYATAEEEAWLAKESGETGRRSYITTLSKHRLHQRAFRERVLDAYRRQCALCRLRHDKLLDAAHIIPDTEADGDPVVENGIALCKLHHAAFEKFFLGIRPDYVIEIRSAILDEDDGPMLTHGLQGLHEKRILVPRSPSKRPSPKRLQVQYDKFLRALP